MLQNEFLGGFMCLGKEDYAYGRKTQIRAVHGVGYALARWTMPPGVCRDSSGKANEAKVMPCLRQCRKVAVWVPGTEKFDLLKAKFSCFLERISLIL